MSEQPVGKSAGLTLLVVPRYDNFHETLLGTLTE